MILTQDIPLWWVIAIGVPVILLNLYLEFRHRKKEEAKASEDGEKASGSRSTNAPIQDYGYWRTITKPRKPDAPAPDNRSAIPNEEGDPPSKTSRS
ncbi:hypothetical protein [Paenibacillus flagellatus]|uniref:Uncharacterized protein n=1 Tax=Paenibacillus flagellatus TaxID=2211139 RepID=A0A2V5KC77_9BACL|nr:hypothetical protein [Paenibacillus flagellatus]PYI51480.1 hypothetical protein DLM86_23930 [Paenibacillus flagellatus]